MVYAPSERMKHLLAGIVLLIVPIVAGAQNLIPNPGFENYSKVPCSHMNGSLSEYVSGWENAASGTPDFLCTEADSACYASPYSKHWDSYGTETPHGGKGMAMIMTTGHQGGTWREYLGIMLSKPLVKGKRYYAEFYVSLGDYSGVATNNLGLLFKTGPFFSEPDYIIAQTPQVNTQTVIDQTNGWYKVSGTFTAAENYTHMIVGNFFTDAQTTVKVMPPAKSYVSPHTYRPEMGVPGQVAGR